jgi:hypothetical protein
MLIIRDWLRTVHYISLNISESCSSFCFHISTKHRRISGISHKNFLWFHILRESFHAQLNAHLTSVGAHLFNSIISGQPPWSMKSSPGRICQTELLWLINGLWWLRFLYIEWSYWIHRCGILPRVVEQSLEHEIGYEERRSHRTLCTDW